MAPPPLWKSKDQSLLVGGLSKLSELNDVLSLKFLIIPTGSLSASSKLKVIISATSSTQRAAKLLILPSHAACNVRILCFEFCVPVGVFSLAYPHYITAARCNCQLHNDNASTQQQREGADVLNFACNGVEDDECSSALRRVDRQPLAAGCWLHQALLESAFPLRNQINR